MTEYAVWPIICYINMHMHHLNMRIDFPIFTCSRCDRLHSETEWDWSPLRNYDTITRRMLLCEPFSRLNGMLRLVIKCLSFWFAFNIEYMCAVCGRDGNGGICVFMGNRCGVGSNAKALDNDSALGIYFEWWWMLCGDGALVVVFDSVGFDLCSQLSMYRTYRRSSRSVINCNRCRPLSTREDTCVW